MPETLESKPIEITLEDGTKIVGANYEEALKNAAKRQMDTANALKTEREEREKLAKQVKELSDAEAARRSETERAAQDAARRKAAEKNGGFAKEEYYRMLNDDPIAAQNYLDAHRLGIGDPAQVPARFNAMAQQITEINQERVASAFWRQHPEFPQDIQAARTLDERVTRLVENGELSFGVRAFNIAYEELVNEGKIKPMEIEEKKSEAKPKPEEERPNPSLTGGGGTGIDEADLRKIESMDDKALEALGRDKGWIR